MHMHSSRSPSLETYLSGGWGRRGPTEHEAVNKQSMPSSNQHVGKVKCSEGTEGNGAVRKGRSEEVAFQLRPQ